MIIFDFIQLTLVNWCWKLCLCWFVLISFYVSMYITTLGLYKWTYDINFLNIFMIRWIDHVLRKVQIICSSIEEEIFIYLENNYGNFELSTEEWKNE